MPLPKISVVTPSFNQAGFLEQNIQSVLDQHYPDVEHIIIDGGSTDGTLDILKKHSHLCWVSEPDRGQTHALNKGFERATGDIIGWLNSDDTYFPDIFRMVASQFEDPKVMVLCGDGFEIDENGKQTHPMLSRATDPEVLIKYWKWRYEYLQPAFFFRRTVFDEVGFLEESLYYVMDYDFFIRLGLRYPMTYLPKPLANLRLHSTSKTGTNIRKIIPGYILEMHKVSRRYWGRPTEFRYYGYLISFLGAVVLSILKNILFLKGSKSRMIVERTLSPTSRGGGV
ncbi:MAG TPA: glycosyltransferase family 2 protein [Bacteroidota bacterium]